MNTHDIDIELPPLRIPDLEDELTAVLCAAISWGGSVISSEEYVAAKQRFRAAVNAAIEADRKRRGEPSKCPECSDPDLSPEKHWQDGYDDGVAAALRRCEPVERPDEYAYFSDWYGKGAPDESEVSAIHMARRAWLAGIQFADLFPTAPQPAEPVKVPSDADILFTMRHLERHLKCIDGAIPTLLSTARALLARYGQSLKESK